jgi:hypothetical protein
MCGVETEIDHSASMGKECLWESASTRVCMESSYWLPLHEARVSRDYALQLHHRGCIHYLIFEGEGSGSNVITMQ